MRKIFCSLCTLVLSVSTVLAQGSIQQLVDLQAAQEPLKGSAWGFYAVDEAGRVLASHNAGMRLMPASNRKLVTTGVALHAFGPDYRFRTSLGYTGTIEPDGTLQGDLYIIGGGDPTLGSADTASTKGIWSMLPGTIMMPAPTTEPAGMPSVFTRMPLICR